MSYVVSLDDSINLPIINRNIQKGRVLRLDIHDFLKISMPLMFEGSYATISGNTSPAFLFPYKKKSLLNYFDPGVRLPSHNQQLTDRGKIHAFRARAKRWHRSSWGHDCHCLNCNESPDDVIMTRDSESGHGCRRAAAAGPGKPSRRATGRG